jgi:hypothetical protein
MSSAKPKPKRGRPLGPVKQRITGYVLPATAIVIQQIISRERAALRRAVASIPTK